MRRREEFDPLWKLHREVNRLFDDAFRGFFRYCIAGRWLDDVIDALIDLDETAASLFATKGKQTTEINGKARAT
jgi:hypothetical protein